MPETPHPFLRRTWVRRTIPAGVVAVLVVGATAFVRTNASASPLDTYRTTTVTTGSVEQRLDLTGSVQRVNQVSQSFAVSGAVSSVSVAVGDTVTAGQALATLDPRPLGTAVIDAEAVLAQAKAALESDQSSSTTTTTTATQAQAQTAARPQTPTSSPRVASPSVRSGAGKDQSITRAQRDLTTAQSTIAGDLKRMSAALAQCVPFFPSEPSPSAPTSAPSSTSTDTATSTATTTVTPPTTTNTPSDAEIKACLGALQTAPTQQKIQRDQQALTRSQADLTKAFTLAITTAGNVAKASGTTSSSGSSQSTNSQSTNSQSSGGQSSGGQSSGGQTGGAGQSAAARVVSDQAAVTSAEAALSSATADRASATLTSSIAGTVGSISLVNGASNVGKSIAVVGAGAVEVTANIPLASMVRIHVGQKANVTPQGATSSVPGAVTAISLLPFTSTSGTGTGTGTATATASSPVYPVVVLVPDALPALASGARANVSLLIGTAGHVITVPNSALTPLGNG